MKETYREGSMGAKEQKNARRFAIVASALFAVILLIFLLPFPVDSAVGYFHAYFKRAGGGWKFIGIAAMVALIWFTLVKSVYLSEKWRGGTGKVIAIILGLLLLGIFSLGGWDFSLMGIEK